MNIDEGFQIESPSIWLPWGISENDLSKLLGAFGLKSVTSGYCTLTATSLDGLKCEIGFHFFPKHGGRLHEIEFFRRSYPNQSESFAEFQRHFEKQFGSPTKTSEGSEEFPSHEWRIGRTAIVHYVIDRFGPEEHMRIKR